MSGSLVRRLVLTTAPSPSRPVVRRPLRVCGGGGIAQKKREASEKRSRRREIELDAAPSEAAKGFCRHCATTHTLERTPRAEAEARELMRRIRDAGRLDFNSDQPADPRFAVERMYEPGGGKMLGVLIAVPPPPPPSEEEEEEEEVVVLKAFSGQMYGEWTVPGWSPPLCGLTHAHPHYVREHARIKALVEAAGAKAKVAEELGAEMKREGDAWDGRINTLAARLREERQARRARRRRRSEAPSESEGALAALEEQELDAALEERLAEESRAGKRELARLRERRAAALAEPSAALAAARDEMNRLRTQHRAMSHVLLGEIFASYRLPNFRGGEEKDEDEDEDEDEVDDFNGGLSGATLREAFVSEDEEKSTAAPAAAAPATEVNLPCGCGDCCAPKLLAECSRRGLTPVAIAEVWMGVPTRKEGDRREGSFYGACRGRCRPILGHMLCGAEERKNKQQLIQLSDSRR